MKKLSSRQLAFTYVGLFLGAGFVSGQELWQFFACFGTIGLLGFLGTCALFFYIVYSCFRLILALADPSVGKLLTCGNIPWLHTTVDMMLILLNFGVLVIMIAGAASLIQQITGLSYAISGGIFTLAVLIVAMAGINGLVSTFSIIVPITTACAVIIGLVFLIRNGFQMAPAVGRVSPMVPNWWIGCISYAAYNLFGNISVLIPFRAALPDAKTMRKGLAGGSIIFIVLAWSIISAMVSNPSAGITELPMSVMASQLHPAFGICYGVLMGAGMFSCALSRSFGISGQLERSWSSLRKYNKTMTIGIYALAFFLSLVGFGELIGIIYPFFGYVSIPFLICIVLNWHRTKKSLNPKQGVQA